MKTPFTTKPGIGAKPLTWEQAGFLSINEILAGEKRGKLDSYGPWQIPVSYKAIAVSQDFNASAPEKDRLTVYGERTLTNPRQSGYCLEGQVSIGGKKYRAFTSSTLFELPNGKLVDVAVIHVCK